MMLERSEAAWGTSCHIWKIVRAACRDGAKIYSLKLSLLSVQMMYGFEGERGRGEVKERGGVCAHTYAH